MIIIIHEESSDIQIYLKKDSSMLSFFIFENH